MRPPLTPLRRVTAVDVVVPVHDEQDLLPACLDALDECIAATPVPVTVTVVLDACSDGSEAVAAGRARLVRSYARSVGIARACGFAAVSRASSSSPRPADPDRRAAPGAPTPATLPGRRWYATTDADSRVPRTWLTDQLALAHAGADVVAGLVEVTDWAEWSPATRLRYLEGYHPGPGHRHIHGANLGLSADAYDRLGGFDFVPRDEDVLLIRRAQYAGLAVAWSTDAPVVTSARRTARAPGGFASHLAELEGDARDPA